MLREKKGRVTFMPLNRLKPKPSSLPTSNDAEPLLSKLSYSPTHEKALMQVFGKTCVCRDLSIAAEYVRSHGINAITLDGDKVDRKGALTGGYHDVRRSRLSGITALRTWRAKHDSEKRRAEEVKAAIAALEQEITRCLSKITVLSGQQTQLRDARERLLEEGASLAQAKDKLGERMARLELDKEELETELRGLDAKLDGYQAELRTPLSHGLTGEEERAIASLGKEVERRRKDMVGFSKLRNEVSLPFLLLQVHRL